MKPFKRSITISGHRTSISLEPAFWEALGEVAQEQGKSVAALVAEIDRARLAGTIAGMAEAPQSGLSGAVRVFLLNHYRARAGVSSSKAKCT